MPSDPINLLIVAVVMFGCAVVQATIGFAFGLLAIPILLWTGMELPHVLALVGAAAAIQSAFSAATYRRHIKWKPVLVQSAIRFTTIPIGVLLLAYLVTFGTDRIKQVVGLFLLLALLMQWALRVKPRRHLHWGWGLLAGSTSGVIGGLVGMGGPPIVLWASAHRWTSKQTRAFLWSSIAIGAPYTLLMLSLKFGPAVLLSAAVGALTFPLLFAGSKLGLRAGRTLPRPQLRQVVLILLLMLALWSLLAPLVIGSSDSLPPEGAVASDPAAIDAALPDLKPPVSKDIP